MFWYVASIIGFLVAMSLIIVVRVRERRILKARIYDTLRPAVRKELDAELNEAKARHARFEEALRTADTTDSR